MPAPDFESYKVGASELSSSTKFDNLVQAVEDEFSDIDPDQISGYPLDSAKFLRGDGAWAAPVTALGYATTLPGTPANGQETILVDSTTAPTYAWHLRYNSTLAKWEFIGGRAAYAEVTTLEPTATTLGSYLALATAGPSIVIPVAGEYRVETGCRMVMNAAGQTGAFMSYDIGGTGAVDADAIRGFDGGTTDNSLMRLRSKTGLTAVTLTAKYKSTGAHGNYGDRWMSVTPVLL